MDSRRCGHSLINCRQLDWTDIQSGMSGFGLKLFVISIYTLYMEVAFEIFSF